MKKIVLYVLMGLLLFSAYGCAHSRDTAPAPTSRQQVSLEDASVLIEELLLDRKGDIREITTDTLWQEMGVQLFSTASPDRYGQVFAIQDGNAVSLMEYTEVGTILEYALADMDGDGQKEMLYTYIWGSGIVRSIMGILKSDGRIVEITPTEEAEGIWYIHNLKAEDNTVTCDVRSALGEDGDKKGICIYKDDTYIFDIEE